ncbi:MAG: hypothetical protein LIO37_02730 [Clostridiales bacterium]|nr:hypothetical protein [Clostridiales bacterium]
MKRLNQLLIALAIVAVCVLIMPTNAQAGESVTNSGYTDEEAALADCTVSIESVKNVKTGIKITWSEVPAASGYYIYRKTSGESYSRIKKVTTNTTVRYTDKKAKDGVKYYYCVKAYNGSATTTRSASKSIKRLTPGNVTSVSNTSNGLKVKWSKVTGASGYYVYRKTGSGSYLKIATVEGASKVSYVDTTGKSGKKYTYCVKAYSGSQTGTYSQTKSKYCLYAPFVTSAENDGSTNITVKWKKRSGVTGYQIIYDTSPTFSTAPQLTNVSASSLTKTLSSLKKGKTYYIQMRSYIKANGKTYFSAWGGVKTIRVLKPYTANVPDDAYSYNGSYYYVYSDEADSHVDALLYCTSQGGFLATILYSQESDDLYEYVTGRGYEKVGIYIDDSSDGEERWMVGDSSFDGFLCEWTP